MRKIYSFAVSSVCILASFLFSSPEASAFEIEVCNDCTLSAMKNTAIGNGSGDVHVVDFENDVLKRYVVIIEREGDFSINVTREVTPDNTVKSEFAAVKSAKRSVYDSIFAIPQVSSSVAGSAWELPGNSQKQNNVGNWILNNQSLNQAIGHYASAIAAMVGKIIGVNFVIEVTFSDGSFANYRITGIDNRGNLTLALENATDADNNSIPLTLSGFTGTYSFSSGGGGIESAASNFGAAMTIIGSTGASAGSITVTCSQKGPDRVESV